MVPRPLNLDVTADLECELDGTSVLVRSTGRKTVVEVPDLATGLKLIQLGSPRGFFKGLHDIKRLMDEASHRLELRVQGKTIGQVGHLEGSRIWRFLGLPVFTLKPLAIATAVLRPRKR